MGNRKTMNEMVKEVAGEKVEGIRVVKVFDI